VAPHRLEFRHYRHPNIIGIPASSASRHHRHPGIIGILASRHPGISASRHLGILASWHLGISASWHFGILASRHPGIVGIPASRHHRHLGTIGIVPYIYIREKQQPFAPKWGAKKFCRFFFGKLAFKNSPVENLDFF
jgi:hypothetical protein